MILKFLTVVVCLHQEAFYEDQADKKKNKYQYIIPMIAINERTNLN